MGKLGGALNRFGFLLPLLVVAALPLPGFSRHTVHEADGLPQNDDSKHPWQYVHGTPQVDTLSYAPRDVLPAALHQFQTDHWEIYTTDPRDIRIVTLWKPMHHPLVRLFMGSVNARCTVTIKPVGRTRTELVFQADLASHHDLERNPMYGTAKKEYVKSARHYALEVREYLETHNSYSSIAR